MPPSGLSQDFQQEITFFDKDANLVLRLFCNLKDLDPAGLAAELDCDGGVGPFVLTWDANARLATYAVQLGDFHEGLYNAQVKLSRVGTVVHTEIFKIRVTKALS